MLLYIDLDLKSNNFIVQFVNPIVRFVLFLIVTERLKRFIENDIDRI